MMNEAVPKGRRMRSDARRAQLLSCAMHVFAERGLGRAAHADVAREAGVSVATTFVYFPTRPDLRDAVLAEIERFLMTLLDDMRADTGPAPKVLFQALWTFTQSAQTARDYVRVWLDWSTAIRDDVWPRYLELQERIVRLVQVKIEEGQAAGTIARDLDPADAARIIGGGAQRVTLMMFGGIAQNRIRHFVQHLVDSALSIRTAVRV